MDTQETQPKPDNQLTFDAEANYRAPFSTEKKGKLFDVAHIFRSYPTDKELLEYERRRNVRMREVSKAEMGEKAIAMKTDSEAASVWLWLTTADRPEGYKQADDWRERISDEDKIYAIDHCLLACQASSIDPVHADEGELADFEDDGETTVNRVELTFLVNGNQVTFFHDLKPAAAGVMKAFRDLMKESYTVKGTKLGKSDIRIPAKAKEIGEIYYQLKVEHDPRYLNRIPLNHRVAVVVEHLNKERETLMEN